MATTAASTTTPAAATTAPAANKTTLFVSDLPKDIEDIENALYRHFGQVGSIVSTKACRDMHTQRLLGHGYVNFQNQADAEKALKTLNFSEIIPGKPIRVSWSQRDPATRKMGTGNLFIKELDDDVTPRMLFEAFSAIGPVASCKLSLDETGKTRHYGFVHYENPALADKALELSEKEQLLVGGKAVVVEHFKKRTDREKEAQASFTHIYIKNLAPEVKLEQISKLCAKFEGEALKEEPFIQLQAPFNTQFALINMNTHEGATKIIEALHEKEGHELGAKDHKLYCARAQTKKERSAAKTLATQQALIQNSGKNLYVKHLDDTMTDEMLRQLFSPYGTIASCSIARFSESGASKGYGFVVFESKESAANAQRELHNKVIGTRPLYVAVAQNRDARIKMLEQQSRNRVQAASMGMPGSIGGMPPHGMMPHHHHHHHHAHHGLPHHHHHHHHHAAMGMYGVPPGMPGAYPPGNWGPNNYPQAGGRGRGGPLGVQGQLPRPPMGGRGGGNNMPRGGAGFPMPGGMPPYPGQFPGQQQQGGHPGQQQGGQHPRGPRPNRGNQNNNNNNNNQNNNNSGATAGLPSLQELSKMTPEEQKNTLGERLFVQVQTIHQPQAAKITGMLLEMDVSEIIHIIENESVLRAKVNEALAVLRDYGVSTAGN